MNPYQLVLQSVDWDIRPDGQHADVHLLVVLLAEGYSGGYVPDALGVVGAARYVIDTFNERFPGNPLSRRLTVELNSLAQR